MIEFPVYRKYTYDADGSYIIVEFTNYTVGTVIESTQQYFTIGYVGDNWSNCSRSDRYGWETLYDYKKQNNVMLDDSLFEVE